MVVVVESGKDTKRDVKVRAEKGHLTLELFLLLRLSRLVGDEDDGVAAETKE